MTIANRDVLESTSNARNPHVRSAVRGIVGKRCWRARLGYGGELHLHLGARVPYRSTRMAGQKQGAWRFGTSGSDWTLKTPTGTVSSQLSSEEQLEQRLTELEGSRVSHFKAEGLKLKVHFDSNCVLTLIPGAENGHEIPHWELFMPRHLYLAFGPGKIWHYGRSDIRRNGD